MALINSVMSWLIKKRIHQIELFQKYPYDVQAEWLRKLLMSASDTEYGKKYDFSGISNADQFRQRLPVIDYEIIHEDIMRLRRGKQNIFWPTDIKWFAKSSGTTCDKSKFIPVSAESLEECHYNGGKDMLSIYCNNNPDTLLFDGKALSMGGSHQISEYDSETYYGDVSAIIIQNLPWWAEFRRTPNLSIALMNEWESKINKMTEVTMLEDVTNIAGVPSWTLVLLKRILEKTGKSNILEVWPNLELFMHGGVSFTPYKEQFKMLIPSSKMNYLETYNASEGFFGIQDRNRADDMLLMLDYGIYYEFIPSEDFDSDNPHTLSLDEVELNKNYALVITTNAGLWRYKIGDTVTFTSLSPHRIKITGRTKNFINAFGEELIIDNAEKAMTIACEKSNALIKDYTAGPVYFQKNESAAHEWLIEFEIPPKDIRYFSEILDNALKSLNSDYEAKRYQNLILRSPVVREIPQGTFYNWLKSKGKLGGQHKVPRLSNDRKYIEEILSMIA
ncbi:MAG TPA: GH3 auxin-responsive promoter family protein [Bacteroidales bacterium]|nr:GH3 auxin-responsive promoter family protein [Bacteroidales bacterium]HPS16449.1 GH3 auxin-responsive promoter family protein [Bacteroidales bacterium]